MEKNISDMVKGVFLELIGRLHVEQGIQIFMNDYLPMIAMLVVAIAFAYIAISELSK